MNILGFQIGEKSERRSFENPSTPLSDPAKWLIDLLGGTGSAGPVVNARTAMTCTPVYGCVNILAQTMASLPLHLYDVDEEGSTTKAKSNPLYKILHDAPASWLTSYRWREAIMTDLALRGPHYSRIVRLDPRDKRSPVKEILPLPVADVKVAFKDGRPSYRVQVNGKVEVYEDWEILHFVGMESELGVAAPPIATCKNAISLALALEQFGSKFFANGANPGLIIEYEGKLSAEGVENLRGSIEKRLQGGANQHKPIVLESGAKVHKISTAPDEAQFLETRKFQVEEIARAFRIPPTFLQDLSRATFSNTEQQDLQFVKHTVRPWLVMLEQELNLKLAGEGQRIEFNVDGLLRGDFRTRMEGYARAVMFGIMTPNEARERENLAKMDGADDLVISANMETLEGLNDEDGSGTPGEA